jgi:hypothetical protein
MERADFHQRIGEANFLPTLETAVARARSLGRHADGIEESSASKPSPHEDIATRTAPPCRGDSVFR